MAINLGLIAQMRCCGIWTLANLQVSMVTREIIIGAVSMIFIV